VRSKRMLLVLMLTIDPCSITSATTADRRSSARVVVHRDPRHGSKRTRAMQRIQRTSIIAILASGCYVGDVTTTDAETGSEASDVSTGNTGSEGGTGESSSTSHDDGGSDSSGSCRPEPEPPSAGTSCDPCVDDSECSDDDSCLCASAFGPGLCLPTTWEECAWSPCDARCFYVGGQWFCAEVGC